LLPLLVVTFLLFGCAAPTETPSIAAPTEAPTKEIQPTIAPSATPIPEPSFEGGDLRIVWAVDMALFDPPQESRGLGRAAINHVFQGLTKLNLETGKPEPDLAVGWTVSDDGLTWTFNLREGVVFQDDTPFNSDAVVANVKRWIDPDFPHAGRSHVADIEDARVLDDFTVEIQLLQPNPLLPASLGHGMQHIVSLQSIEAYGVELGLHLPAGTGPYKVAEFIPREKIVMERWDGYLGSEEVYLDRIIWETVPEDSARTARLLAGEADINAYQSLQDVPRVEADPGLEILSGRALRQWHFYINMNQPHLADIRVRQALNHAVDQDGLVVAAFQGFASTRYSLIGAGHNGAIEVNPIYEYNPDKAIDLMEEAGWTMGPDGKLQDADGNVFVLRLDITTGGTYPQDDGISEAVAGMFEAIGVEMNVVRSDRTTFFATVAREEAAIDRNEVVGLPVSVAQQDAAHFLRLIYGETSLPTNCCNWAIYKNEDSWTAIANAFAEADPETRLELMEEAQRLIWDDVVTIPLPQTHYVFGKSKSIQGILMSPGELHQFAFAWFEPQE
jgi:peptide/nickel transport system substrate-binding protein